MSEKKKKKIVIASDEEVAQYGGHTSENPDGTAGSSPEPAEKSMPGESTAASEAEQWKEKFLRAQAELVNFQRRAARERDEAVRYAVAPLVRSLLPILDDLERVITSGREHPDNAQAILDGVQMTLENFLKVLREAYVEPIKAEGVAFDPQVHEAVMERPSDEHPDRVVLEEVQRGYRLHDRVLRPAKVIVSKPTGGTEHTTPEGPDSESETARGEQGE